MAPLINFVVLTDSEFEIYKFVLKLIVLLPLSQLFSGVQALALYCNNVFN